MQVVLDTDEAWSLMTVMTSHLIDRSGISQDGKQAIRQWRTARDKDSPAMAGLASAMNEAIGSYVDQKTDRTIRRKGRYIKASERR